MSLKNKLCNWSNHRLGWCPTCKKLNRLPLDAPMEPTETNEFGACTVTGALWLNSKDVHITHPTTHLGDSPMDWTLIITKVSNGYILDDGDNREVLEFNGDLTEKGEKETDMAIRLCWRVIEQMDLYPDKFAPHTIEIVDIPGRKYGRGKKIEVGG